MIEAEAIRTGLKNGEFFLEYLPTVSLKDGRCIGCEALIRWRRGARIVPPLEFIPQIENTLLSGTVTYWVIDTVAHEIGAWLREHEGVHISVNVPPGIFGRGGLASAIANTNLLDVVDQLVVEITERGVPDKLEVDAKTKAGGERSRARVALDDIGLTDASLVTLSQARVDIVKIDRSFIDQMLQNDCPPQKLAALSALVKAAKHTVIAEGVESAAQVEVLKKMGVHMAQGWYFSRPLAAAEFKKYFAAHQ